LEVYDGDEWKAVGVSKEKRIEAFTGSGNWTVPANVHYAIAHMRGGGGGVGNTNTGGDGGDSTVAFAGGTVSAPGNRKSICPGTACTDATAGAANSGQNAISRDGAAAGASNGGGSVSGYIVAGGPVTPAATVAVVVGAGGSAGTSGAAGGSGYVYIEYYEEV
jgi:hypothetical protein